MDSCARCCGCEADLPGALAHGRRAVELAESAGSPFSQVEAAAFLRAAELAAGDVATATSALETALGIARTRHTALWYEPRILATLRGREARRRATAPEPALSWPKPATPSSGDGAGDSAPATSSWRGSVSSPQSPSRTAAAIERALESVDALAAELDADPYRRMAELERARLARTISVTPR